MTRILSLWLPTLSTDRVRRLGLGGKDTSPLVTVTNVRGAQIVAAVDSRAQAGAIRPGMSLADARAIRPDLHGVQAEPQAEAETLHRILDWCRRFTPLAALDTPDGLLLDVTGGAHLFGGEAALMATAETRLAQQGFASTAAIADTPEAAWALARFSATKVASSETIRDLVDPLPLAALRIDTAAIQALAQAGLRRVGDLLIRPRAPIAARFGQALFARLDGILGHLKTPIRPLFPVPAFLAERRFADAVTREDAVEASILSLAGHLCRQLTAAGVGARRIEALFFRVDGAVKTIAFGTSRPLRDPQAITRLFHERLSSLGEDGLDTGYGFEVIRLGADHLEAVAAHQTALNAREGSSAHEADLAMLVDRLGARLGFKRVVRLQDNDHHIPEQAAVEIPALRDVAHTLAQFEDGADLFRPFKLFDRPEPIDTVAAVPDGPPASFRWRRSIHSIVAIEGPERIAGPWWTEPTPTRDYFQAEDHQGRRFWLFRQGLYGTETVAPRWFLHGLFS